MEEVISMALDILWFMVSWFACGMVFLMILTTFIIVFRLLYLMLNDSGIIDDIFWFLKGKKRDDKGDNI